MEAKRIIDSQLAFAPSCEELSQQVHLSLTKLTRGFSSFCGMPIHQYVIEQRLTQAAQPSPAVRNSASLSSAAF